MTNMNTWNELRIRLDEIKQLINTCKKKLWKRKSWRQALYRLFSVVKGLAMDNLAFIGSKEKLYQDNNDTIFEFSWIDWNDCRNLFDNARSYEAHLGS